MKLRKFLKTWMLLIAMFIGIIFHNYIGVLKPLSPYLIFAMLTVTFTRIKVSEIRITRFQLWLLVIQVAMCWVAYGLIAPWDRELAGGVFICVFISTATSAPVITSILGGSIATLVSYSLLSSLTFAIFAPLFLSVVSDYEGISFIDSFSRISTHVLPLVLGPLALALLMGKYAPRAHQAISQHQSISFYLWAVALVVVVGNAVSFAMKPELRRNEMQMIYLALGALVVCCLQFYIGRKVGKHFGDQVAGAQGLGQKNTVLAIWVAMTYLHPITSLAPASYVLWQNIINSAQLWYHNRKL